MRTFATSTLVAAGVFGWAVGGGLTPHPAAAPAQAAAATDDDWRVPHASAGTITLDRGWNDHFFVSGDVHGRPLRFVVDTGASTVALSRSDAAAIGIDIDHLDFDGEAQTANGTVRIAHVWLPQLRIGDIQLLQVRAAVLDTPDGMPLLGQSFLSRLDHVDIAEGRMTLTKL